MFDFVHGNKKLIQIVLALITLPFAFWGVDSYRQSGNSADVIATVNDAKITQRELENALRQHQDRLRQRLGANFDPAMFDNPEMKRAVMDDLVSQRLLVDRAKAAGLVISDEQVAPWLQHREDALERSLRVPKMQHQVADEYDVERPELAGIEIVDAGLVPLDGRTQEILREAEAGTGALIFRGRHRFEGAERYVGMRPRGDIDRNNLCPSSLHLERPVAVERCDFEGPHTAHVGRQAVPVLHIAMVDVARCHNAVRQFDRVIPVQLVGPFGDRARFC